MSLNLPLDEIKNRLANAKTLEDIGSLFNDCFYGGVNSFTKESFILGEAVVQELQSLAETETPAPAKLYDFLNSSVQVDRAILADNPAYEDILKKSKNITSDQIKDDLEKNGQSLSDKILNDLPIDFDNILSNKKNLVTKWKIVTGKFKIENNKSEDAYEEDRELLAEKVWNLLKNDYQHDEYRIKNIITGKIITGIPKTKKEKIFYKNIQKAREKSFYEDDEGFSEEFKNLRRSIIHFEKKLKEETNLIFQKITTAINDASPISLEEAKKWSQDNVYISDKVAKKLDDMLYPAEELRKDIAEYYRYVGGKLGPVEFISERGNNRAFARGRFHICLDKNFNKGTLFHECSHLVEEWDQSSLQGSIGFVKSRAVGKPVKLKILEPRYNYKNDEYAYPDNFINSYVGKDYGSRASEVMSMGMEQLADPLHLASFIAKDREHFNLVLGQCLHHSQHIGLLTQSVNKQIAKETGEKNNKNNIIVEFLKELDKAIKMITPAFEELLVHVEPYKPNTYSLLIIGRAKAILSYTNEKGQSYSLYSGSKKEALRAAYLHFLGQEEELFTNYDPGNPDIEDDIKKYAAGLDSPAWFETGKTIPKLSTMADLQQKSKQSNMDKKLGENRKKAFLDALEKAITDKFKEVMKSDHGYDGYSLFIYSYTDEASLYSTHIESKYICDENINICFKIAYLLILNRHDMLPQNYGNDKRAFYTFIDWIKKGNVPEWFDPENGLPELTL